MTVSDDVRVEGNGDRWRYRVPPDRSVSEAVVTAVAGAAGRQPASTLPGDEETLDPLYEVVDPDALDALFRRSAEAAPGTITFTYSGFEVTVEGGAVVRVAPE